jgi:hypothetical protein
MKCRVTTLGSNKEYGEQKTVAELDDVGPVFLREMEIASLDELTHLAGMRDVESVELETDSLSEYDIHLTVVCDDSL